MANAGKFRDSTPLICPAGKVEDMAGSVAECLNVYTLDDHIETVMHEGGLKQVDSEGRQQKMGNWRHRGAYDQVHEAIHLPVETRYQSLLKDLKETVMDSYWNKEIGRCRDPLGGLPKGMNPYTTTFGQATKSDNATVGELVNPPVTRLEILLETNEHHPMYKKSHMDYYPGEQVKRDYCQPPFNPKKMYGCKCNYDPLGRCMQKCFTHPNSETTTTSNQVQADVFYRTKHRLGTALTPNHSIDCVPPGHRFGKKSDRPLQNTWVLMHSDMKVNLTKYEFYEWLTHLYEMRKYIKKHSIDLAELTSFCLYYDQGRTGWIDIGTMIGIFSGNNISFNHSLLFPLARFFGFLKDNEIRYKQFIDLFNSNIPVPSAGKWDEGEICNNYRTSYNDAILDYLRMDNSCCPPAGVPSVRTFPTKPEGGCLADITSLGSETTVEMLVSPNIFTNYGLSHRDFWEPRTPEYMKNIFEKLGYQFPNDTFEQLWALGQKIDKSDKVCVETFRAIMREAAPLKIKPQPPMMCEDENLLKRKNE